MLRALMFTAVCLQALLPAAAYYDKELFKSMVFNDRSNDDAIHMNAQQLIKRSGFDYEEHYVIGDDGYITLLVRIVNPLVKRANLRGPPVLLYHGANVDQALYVVSSSIQHHPEAWPRTVEDGPMTSWNRSLGFMLANNGHDVWLMGTRGSNELNQGFTEDVRAAHEPGFKPTPANYELIRWNKKRYWSYGLDDIIKYEIRAQLDKVLAATGAKELSIFSFSLSTPTTMAFLAAHPEYARRVRVYFQLAPAISADHFTTVDKIYFEKLCPYLPTRGIGFTPTYLLKPFTRNLILKVSRSNHVRYSLVYKFITTLFGPSLKYHTNLERNFLAHIFQPVSFKSVQHYCQGSVSKRFTKFDYGNAEKNAQLNGMHRGDTELPAYDLSRLEVQNWVVISGTYDALADATTVQRLIEQTSTPKPVKHLVCPGFNHADFHGAVENDKHVNLPVLEILNANAD